MTSSPGASAPTAPSVPGDTPKGRLQGAGYWAVLLLGSSGLLMAINQTFNLSILGFQPLGNSYLYYLIGIFLAAAFLCFPAWPGAGKKIPWYDWVLGLLAMASCGYLGFYGLTMIQQGWEFEAPLEATVSSAVLLLMILEGVRRCGGWPLLFVALFLGTYPLYAGSMPGFLWGNEYTLPEIIRAHVIGVESVIGIPMQVVAQLVIGFVVFGAALTITGGGEFFMKFATALMGRSRGGLRRNHDCGVFARLVVLSGAAFSGRQLRRKARIERLAGK